MKRFRLLLCFIALSVFTSLTAFAQGGHFVFDAANLLDAQTEQKLESLLTSFERQTSIEIAVDIPASLNENVIEDYAVTRFEQLGVGKKGKDNGLLFVIAPHERKTRIEVGYGLEGVINDSLAGRILDNAVIPSFKQGDFESGVVQGTLGIIDVLNKKLELNFTFSGNIPQSKKADVPWPFKILLGLFFLYMLIKHPRLLLFLLLTSGGNRSGGGRGFGGGFGGFGGGLSGGGGSSRGW